MNGYECFYESSKPKPVSWNLEGIYHGSSVRDALNLDVSRVVPTGSENRPINILKREWKRVQ